MSLSPTSVDLSSSQIRNHCTPYVIFSGGSIAARKISSNSQRSLVNVLAIGKTKVRRGEYAKDIALAIIAVHCNLLTAVRLIIARANSNLLCAMIV